MTYYEKDALEQMIEPQGLDGADEILRLVKENNVPMDIVRAIAAHQYQQDRAEFAKLKAKEWQDGFDSGVKAQADHFPDTTKMVGLDEAAAKVDIPYEEINNTFEHYNIVEICKKLRSAAFKAGAKWMAEQGETHNEMVYAFNGDESTRYISGIFLSPLNFNLADKVIVQIRKKYE